MALEQLQLSPDQHDTLLSHVTELLARETALTHTSEFGAYDPYGDLDKMKDLFPDLQDLSKDELSLYLSKADYVGGLAVSGVGRIIRAVQGAAGVEQIKDISSPFTRSYRGVSILRGWQQTDVSELSYEGTIRLRRKVVQAMPQLRHVTIEAYTHGVDINASRSDAASFTLTSNTMLLNAEYPPVQTGTYTGLPYHDLTEILEQSLEAQ